MIISAQVSERYVNRLLSAAPAPTGAATVDDLEGHGVVRGLAHRGGEERRVRVERDTSVPSQVVLGHSNRTQGVFEAFQ